MNNVVRKRKDDLNSEMKNIITPRRRKVSVNEPLDIVIISEAKASNAVKDLNNNKEKVQIQVPKFTTIQPVKVKQKPFFYSSTKLIKEVNHFAISVDDSYDADSEDELFTQDIQVNVDEFE